MWLAIPASISSLLLREDFVESTCPVRGGATQDPHQTPGCACSQLESCGCVSFSWMGEVSHVFHISPTWNVCFLWKFLFEAGQVRLLQCTQFSLVQVHASFCMPYLEQGTKQEIWISRNARSESDTESVWNESQPSEVTLHALCCPVAKSHLDFEQSWRKSFQGQLYTFLSASICLNLPTYWFNLDQLESSNKTSCILWTPQIYTFVQSQNGLRYDAVICSLMLPSIPTADHCKFLSRVSRSDRSSQRRLRSATMQCPGSWHDISQFHRPQIEKRISVYNLLQTTLFQVFPRLTQHLSLGVLHHDGIVFRIMWLPGSCNSLSLSLSVIKLGCWSVWSKYLLFAAVASCLLWMPLLAQSKILWITRGYHTDACSCTYRRRLDRVWKQNSVSTLFFHLIDLFV